jgi:Holliday junction resolvase RusA-like endonuclease
LKQLIIERISCKPVTFGNGHSDPDSAYNKFKNAIKKSVPIKQTLCGRLSVVATIYLTKERSARSDIDNYAKPIIDALYESKAFNSESQIYKLLLIKTEVDSSNEEGLAIEILEQ